jgi:hypothetical protein
MGKLAKWLRSLTLNHVLLNAVGSNPDRDLGFFHSSYIRIPFELKVRRIVMFVKICLL